jgi:hypothetical protein
VVYGVAARPASSCFKAGLNAYGHSMGSAPRCGCLVAAVYRGRAVPAVLFYALFIGVGLLLGAIGVGAFLTALRPSRE